MTRAQDSRKAGDKKTRTNRQILPGCLHSLLTPNGAGIRLESTGRLSVPDKGREGHPKPNHKKAINHINKDGQCGGRAHP